jgi:hypothetical protein
MGGTVKTATRGSLPWIKLSHGALIPLTQLKNSFLLVRSQTLESHYRVNTSLSGLIGASGDVIPSNWEPLICSALTIRYSFGA